MVKKTHTMLTTFLVIAPPALHPRTSLLLGDSAVLHFVPDSAVSTKCVLPAASESVDCCYVELPDALASVDPSVVTEIMRVLKKGAKVRIRHRASTKWTDPLLFRF